MTDAEMPTVESLFTLLSTGAYSKLSKEDKIRYYNYRCKLVELDPMTMPFVEGKNEKTGKTTLIPTKSLHSQLTAKHRITHEIKSRTTEGTVHTVVTRSTRGDTGVWTDEIGCVGVGGAAGRDLSDKLMTAVTKAKNRATLYLCGLGMLDETELADMNAPNLIGTALPKPKPYVAAISQADEALRRIESPPQSIQTAGNGSPERSDAHQGHVLPSTT